MASMEDLMIWYIMGTPDNDHPSDSSEKRFEVNKPRVSAHEEVLNKIDPLFREAGQIIRGMPLSHLRIVQTHAQAFMASVNMEEKWRHNEVSQCVKDCQPNETSQQPSARAERFAARLKRRRVEHKIPPGGGKFDYPVHNGIIILDSDVDEPEYPQEVVGAVSEGDVCAAREKENKTAYGEDEATEDAVEASTREDAEVVEEDAEAFVGEDAEASAGAGFGEDASTEDAEVAAGTASGGDVCCRRGCCIRCLKEP
ncbi:uncharacterized protein LOC113286245 isoform X2 [Papaver somniferum]|uniref:uncharacterized protein LOC113286245 isoform X2 n=1 Tax=Papaver somniferum TaxID=3469 RepID=UPI000E6F894A|nr:uncharacterized protein LOC113286245 isoform X2 [Papaver somniferum]